MQLVAVKWESNSGFNTIFPGGGAMFMCDMINNTLVTPHSQRNVSAQIITGDPLPRDAPPSHDDLNMPIPLIIVYSEQRKRRRHSGNSR